MNTTVTAYTWSTALYKSVFVLGVLVLGCPPLQARHLALACADEVTVTLPAPLESYIFSPHQWPGIYRRHSTLTSAQVNALTAFLTAMHTLARFKIEAPHPVGQAAWYRNLYPHFASGGKLDSQPLLDFIILAADATLELKLQKDLCLAFLNIHRLNDGKKVISEKDDGPFIKHALPVLDNGRVSGQNLPYGTLLHWTVYSESSSALEAALIAFQRHRFFRSFFQRYWHRQSILDMAIDDVQDAAQRESMVTLVAPFFCDNGQACPKLRQYQQALATKRALERDQAEQKDNDAPGADSSGEEEGQDKDGALSNLWNLWKWVSHS